MLKTSLSYNAKVFSVRSESMGNNAQGINIRKLLLFILKRVWIIILCAGIGVAGMYYYSVNYKYDTYTASATVYVTMAGKASM